VEFKDMCICYLPTVMQLSLQQSTPPSPPPWQTSSPSSPVQPGASQRPRWTRHYSGQRPLRIWKKVHPRKPRWNAWPAAMSQRYLHCLDNPPTKDKRNNKGPFWSYFYFHQKMIIA